MTENFNTIRQITEIQDGIATLHNGDTVAVTGKAEAGMYYVLWSNGDEQFITEDELGNMT